jgi:single-strand DNA-binding protein
MSGVNKVTILGRLGKDPEMKSFNNGNSVANFSIATSEEWKDKTTGEKKSNTEWHNIVAYTPFAEIVSKYLNKGDQVYIEGKLKTRSWEKDGVTRYVTEVIASSVQLLGGNKRETMSEQDSGWAPSGGGPSSDSSKFHEKAKEASGFEDLPF